MEKLKSRKLWITIVGNLIGVALIFWPNEADTISGINVIAGSIISTLTNLGYLIAQGSVDKAGQQNEKD